MAKTMQLGTTVLAVSLGLAADAAQPPVVRVEANAPLTVVGNGFRDHESVRVTIVMGTRRFAGDTVASPAGEFRARFSGVTLQRCATPLVISARGESTGLVTAQLPPRDCAAP
jgi:hypothetical protein